jgi:hypothetical protein
VSLGFFRAAIAAATLGIGEEHSVVAVRAGKPDNHAVNLAILFSRKTRALSSRGHP